MVTLKQTTSPLIESTLVKATLVKAVLAASMLGVLAGCAGFAGKTETSVDPRVTHPIQVAREQVSTSIAIPAEGVALAPDDARRLMAFVRDYVGRGRTAVTVESQMGDQAKAVLTANGLRENEIVLITDTTVAPPAALLTFTANVAKAPDCGDWSDRIDFQPSNDPPLDYGCATRRNTALTTADPGDLITQQPMSGHGAARRDTVFERYNTGQPIMPAPPAVSATTGAGTGQ